MFNCFSLLINRLVHINDRPATRLFGRAAVFGMLWLSGTINSYAVAAPGGPAGSARNDTITPVNNSNTDARADTLIAPDRNVPVTPALNTGDTIRAGDKKADRFSGAANKGKAADQADSTLGRPDTTAGKDIKALKLPYRHQVRIGLDLARVGFNFMFPSRVGFEFQADYALRKNAVYLAAEAGYGRGNIDYSFLKYTTQSTFARIGIEKSFLDKVGDEDFDIGFLGFRYGIAGGSYSDAEFSVLSPFGGKSEGEEPGRNFVVHWGEIVGGIKVEVWRGIFLGWTVRGKFLFNPKQFRSISPNYIAGYGKGDRTSIFDFNFYLSYALRWTK